MWRSPPNAVTTTVSVPQQPTAVTLFAATQTVTAAGTDVAAQLDGATAKVLPARFTLRSSTGGAIPAGITAEVVDAATLRLTGPTVHLVVATPGGSTASVALHSGTTSTVSLPGTVAYPLPDAALGCGTFPNGPLPGGMPDPSAVVDGDAGTSWTPGSAKARIVVDLGAAVGLQKVTAAWTAGQVPSGTVAFSSDGVSYGTPAALSLEGSTASLSVRTTARYVALAVTGWASGGARLTGLSVVPA